MKIIKSRLGRYILLLNGFGSVLINLTNGYGYWRCSESKYCGGVYLFDRILIRNKKPNSRKKIDIKLICWN
jgi:hypothetical protein